MNVRLTLGVLASSVAACSLVTDLSGLGGDAGADASLDAGRDSASAADGGDAGKSDAACAPSPGHCCANADCRGVGEVCSGPGGVCGCPSATYNSLGGSWAAFDVSTVNAAAKGFYGAAFDGRYLYLLPSAYSTAVRYDTTADFGSAASWSSFDVSTVSSEATGFQASAFDGRYVYLVPFSSGSGANGVVVRYDTTTPFGSAASWSSFDVSTVNGGAKGFRGAAFDGRYLYLAPYDNGVFDGVVARYDTTAGFGSATSWATFDVSAINAAAAGFNGAAFDGRYVYLVPQQNASGFAGVAARYDTTAGFGSAGSWQTFDVSTVNVGAKGFRGATFDGRYVYLVPNTNNSGASGLVARYDTTASFGSVTSWQTFDVSTVNGSARGFRGARFDGRYVYLVPNYGGASGLVARYDTTAGFASASSWGTFDATTVQSKAKGFAGAVFDGRYLYLVPFGAPPTYYGAVARFDAKSPACEQPAWNASFP